MTVYPWLRPIPWYWKTWRLLHCMASMMSPAVLLGYWIDDLDYLIKTIKNP